MENTLPQNSQFPLNSEIPTTPPANSNVLKLAIVGLLILLPIVAISGYYLGKQNSSSNSVVDSLNKGVSETPLSRSQPSNDNQVACTEEARVCPDGSSVVRSGPNCEFAECPQENKNVDETSSWKESSISGITFKYHPEWHVISDESPVIRVQNYDPRTALGRGYDAAEDKGKFFFSFMSLAEADKQGVTSIEQLKQYLKEAEKDGCYYFGDPSGSRIILSESVQESNNLLIYKRTSKCESNQSIPLFGIYILNQKGKTVVMNLGLDTDEGKKYLEQFISTFRF